MSAKMDAIMKAQEADKVANREMVMQETVDPLIFELRDAGFNIVTGYKDKKHPNVNWTKYQKEFVPDDEFSKMCLNSNTGLWCLITGQISNNIIVIDVDSPDVYNSFFKKYEGLTVIVKTPSGGKHLWFKCDTIVKNSTNYNGFPIDIRGDGGLVVAPGSVSDNGTYEFVSKCDLNPIKIKNIDEVLKMIPVKKKASFSDSIEKFNGDVLAAGFDIHHVMEELGVEGFVTGAHGDYKCPCMIHHSKTGEPLEVYLATNSYFCHGCHASGDIIDIVSNILDCDFNGAVTRLEEMSGVKSDILKKRDLQSECDLTNCKDVLNWVKSASTVMKMRLVDEYELVNDKGVFKPGNFINWLMYASGEHFITLKDMYKNEGIMRYSNGVYKQFGAKDIETIADLLIEPHTNVKPGNHNEIITSIKAKTYLERVDIDTNPDVINMVNGLYNIKTGELLPHTHEYPSFIQTMITYDPDATCPNIDKFISELVNKDKVQMIYEIMGYSYRNEKLMKTAFIFLGEKNSGKSKLLDLIKIMIGRQGVSSVSAQLLANTIFGAAEVSDKLANIVGDLGNTALIDTGLLKSIIYGELINVQRKGGMLYDTTPKCVLIYGTNDLPTTKSENEDAFKGRFQIIDFPNLFEGANDDKRILDKLTTPEELSGFFNKAMAAMRTVGDQGHFTNSETLDDRVKAYDYASNPTLRFIDSQCEFGFGIGYETDQSILYPKYQEWCLGNKSKAISKGKFTQLLETERGVRIHRPKRGGEQVPVYQGIKLKSEMPSEEDVLDEMENW